METKKQPYELLVRWDREGKVQGAHVQNRIVITEGGAFLGETIGNAEPLKLGEFPLQDVLTEVQASALADVMRMQEEAALAKHDHEAAVAAMAERVEQANAQLRAMTEELEQRDGTIANFKAAHDDLTTKYQGLLAEAQRQEENARVALASAPTEEEWIREAVEQQLATVRFNAEVARRVAEATTL